MKVRFVFAWYDLWVGAYWDRERRRLYVLPLPCIGVSIDIPKSPSRAERAMCRCIQESIHLDERQSREMARYFQAVAENNASVADQRVRLPGEG